MTSTKVLLVCIQFRWDAASYSSAANCQTLTQWPASAGECFNPGSVRFFGKAAAGCCPHGPKPCCWHEWWWHIPCLWDLAPSASVYLAGSLNFSSSSTPSLAALAFVLASSSSCSCRWAAGVGERLHPWVPATVKITQGVFPLQALFSPDLAFCKVLGTSEG